MRDQILTYLLEHTIALPIEMARAFSDEEHKVERRTINQCLAYDLSPQGLAVQVSPQRGWRLTPAGIREAEDLKKPNLLPLITDINKALSNEIDECKKPHKREYYSVAKITPILYDKHIYAAELDLNDDYTPHFHEGLRISFVSRRGRLYFEAEVVEYDEENYLLYFTTTYDIDCDSRNLRIEVDRSFLIEGLRNRIIAYAQSNVNPNIPLYKFITGTTQTITPISHPSVPAAISKDLDDKQKAAFDAAIDNDITFIWGPPGTGKSFTLAAIIRGLYEFPNERTVVCCVSNAAVDQLVNKVIDSIVHDHISITPGNIYRAGRTTDERILSTKFLFPEDNETKRLLDRIARNNNTIATTEYKSLQIQLKAENRDLKAKLRDHTDYLKAKSRIVFSTIANFTLHNTEPYDNLIVDEASMLSFPELMALASKVTKRIILVGDFQQLSPISLTDNEWLKNSIFKHCGIDIDHDTHPALRLLLNQRRSNTQIVSLYNNTFYKDKLESKVDSNDTIINNSPNPGSAVVYVPVENSNVRFTRGGTRQNTTSAERIVELLNQLCDSNLTYSIGIITPFVGQVNLLRALVKEQNYPEQFAKLISIGTVHTFQGAECDIIIFDIVDSNIAEQHRTARISKLYEGTDGEQLLNVAISRARQKLYVVGNIDWFISNADKEITRRTIAILNKIRRPRQPQLQTHHQPLSREHKKWTKAEEEKLVRLFKEDVDYSQMEKELKRAESAIKGRLQKLGCLIYDKDTQSYKRI